MRRLPLHVDDPLAAIERVAAAPLDQACARCALSAGKKTVCPRPAGTGVGGVLVVVDQLTGEEERSGVQGTAPIHRLIAGYVHAATGRGAFMLDAAVKCHAGATVPNASIEACRPYLRETLNAVRPTRVVACGPRAAQALLGRAPHLMSTRRGYGWLHDAPWARPRLLRDGRVAGPVPVFLVMHPGMSQANAFVKRWLDDDVKWACRTPEPALPPWDACVEVVETRADAELAAAAIRAHAAGVAFDVETGGRMHSGELRVASFGVALVGTDRSWVWDAAALADPGAFEVLADVMEDAGVPKIAQSVKFDMQAIRQGMGVEIRGLAGDTRIWRKQVDSDAKADLETMQELVGMGGGKEEFDAALNALVKDMRKVALKRRDAILAANVDVQDALKGEKEQIQALLSQYDHRLSADDKRVLWRGHEPKAYAYAEVEPDLLSRYNATDCVSTGLLAQQFDKQMTALDLHHAWDNLWGPATEALVQVESWGFMVDVKRMRALSMLLGRQIDAINARFACYPSFDPNSPKSVADLLFKQLGLRSHKKTPTGAPSTDHESLEALRGQHPVLDDLLEHRRVSKLKSQYADGLILHVAPDGRIHTTYNVDGARSGRASSENPNLQNIPSEEKSDDGKMIKDMFTAPPGYRLLASDYKQLEFRVAADLADDPEMKAVFLRGEDFHQATAELIAPIVWKIGAHQVTKAHRRGAKAFNFGIMYGMLDPTIAHNAGCDLPTARMIRQSVLGKFKKFAAWIQQCLAYTRKHGVAWTYWHGRKAHQRQLFKICDADDGMRINAENSSYNTPVQGTASFYCLASVTELVRWIIAERIDAKVVSTVHDSIVIEVRDDLLEMVARKMKAVMEGHPTMTGVPLGIDMKVGTTWGSMSEYLLPEEQAADMLGGPGAVAVMHGALR